MRPTSNDFFPYDLSTNIDKDLIHPDPPPSGCLVVGYMSPSLGNLECFGPGYQPILLEISLVASNDDGHVLGAFDADNLVAKFGQFTEAVGIGDGEDEQEAMAFTHIEFADGRVLFYAGCVETVLCDATIVHVSRQRCSAIP